MRSAISGTLAGISIGATGWMLTKTIICPGAAVWNRDRAASSVALVLIHVPYAAPVVDSRCQ